MAQFCSFYHKQKNPTILDIDLPTWPAKLVVPFALSVLALRLLLQIWAYLRALIQGAETPVAVPLIESAATVAAKEAQALLGNEADREAAQ